jgi:hypothetical protein
MRMGSPSALLMGLNSPDVAWNLETRYISSQSTEDAFTYSERCVCEESCNPLMSISDLWAKNRSQPQSTLSRICVHRRGDRRFPKT